MMSRYTKLISALLGGIATWGYTASDGGISTQEWFGLLGALATAFAVFQFPNVNPEGPGDPDISEMDGPPLD